MAYYPLTKVSADVLIRVEGLGGVEAAELEGFTGVEVTRPDGDGCGPLEGLT